MHEGMAAGLHVVALDFGTGAHDDLDEGSGGVVSYLDVKTMAEVMIVEQTVVFRMDLGIYSST